MDNPVPVTYPDQPKHRQEGVLTITRLPSGKVRLLVSGGTVKPVVVGVNVVLLREAIPGE